MNSRSKITYNVMILFIRQLISFLLSFVLIFFLPTGLGDAGLGRYTFATSLMGIMYVLIAAGTTMYTIKEIARDPERVGLFLPNLLLLRLLFMVPMWLIVLGLMYQSNYPDETRLVVYIIAAASCLSSFGEAFVAVLIGLENTKWQALAETISKIFLTGTAIYFIKQGHGVVTYAWITLIAALITLSIEIWPFVTVLKTHWRVDYRFMRLLLTGGLPFLFYQLFVAAYGQIDVYLLRILTTDAVVGWYGAANQLLALLALFPIILNQAILPAMSRMHLLSPEQMRRTARKGIEVVVLTTLPLAIGISILAGDIIRFLKYPVEFNHSIPLLMLLSFMAFFSSTLMVLGSVANAADRQKQWAIMMAIMIVVKIPLSFSLIRYSDMMYGNGAIGAALAPTITEAVMLLACVRILPPGVLDRSVLLQLSRTLVAGLGMGIVVWLLRNQSPLPFILIVVAGGMVYGSLALITQSIRWHDVLELKAQLLDRVLVRQA